MSEKKNEKNDGIKIFVSFILLFALGVSMFAVFKTGDKLLSSLDGYLGIEGTTSAVTDASGNPSGSQQTTAKPQNTTAKTADIHMYDDDIGWVTVDDVTYFFRKYSLEYDQYRLFWFENVNDYNDYYASLHYSQDGVNWELYDYDETYGGCSMNSMMYSVIYISYTCIHNCSNPEQVIEELADVFFSPDYFDVRFSYAIGDGSGTSPS